MKQTNAISICVGIKNRTQPLINNLIESLLVVDTFQNIDIELSVFDCGSDDVVDVESHIKKYWLKMLKYKEIPSKFTRAHSLNAAVKQARFPWVFLCDADMSLPPDFPSQYFKNVSENQAWFPICFSLGRNKSRKVSSENGWWRESGFGMVGMSRKYFLDIGGFNEKAYIKWGGEDNHLYDKTKIKKVRERCYGLFHNWHESPMNKWTTPPRFQ